MLRIKFKEHYIYIFIIAVMSALYLYVRFFALDESLFGFNQLKTMKFRMVFISYACIGLIIMLAPLVDNGLRSIQKVGSKNRFQVLIVAVVLAMICATLFFLFRNEFINTDGYNFTRKFMNDIPEKGSHVTHDEMWELYLHSRFWYYTNRFLGWSVPFSYQVISSLAGGLFIFLLSYFSNYQNKRGIYFFIGMLSGGYMQLFFGDAENYTLVSLLLLLYFMISERYISGKHSIIAPTVILAIAITFHLLAGWLLPSLLVLFWQAYKRREYKEIALSILFFLLIISMTLIFFHYNGLPIDKLFSNSHALGHGGTIRMLATPSLEHYWQIVNLLFLLFPPILFFIPMLIYKRIRLTTNNIFLAVSAACMLLLMFIWNPILGVYEDWNLFAPGIIPLAILFWHNFTVIENLKYKSYIYFGILLISAIHSYSWIVSNHYYNMDHSPLITTEPYESSFRG